MTEIALSLDITRLIVGTAILAYASYTDIKTRRASNILWLIMGSIGAILLAIQYFTIGFENPFYLIFVPIMIALMYVLFQLRLMFGGADAKAIMALAILVPFAPEILEFPIVQASTISMPGSWIVFSNSVVLFLLIPLSLLIFNLAKRHIEFPHCLLGYRMNLSEAKEKFVWPLEKIVDGKRKFYYMPKKFDAEDELQEFENLGIKKIWVTPKIPFMIPLLAGFICSFILGDVLSYLVQLFV